MTLAAEKRDIMLKIPELYNVKLDGSTCEPYPHVELRHKGLDEKTSVSFDDNHVALFTNLLAREYEVSFRPRGTGNINHYATRAGPHHPDGVGTAASREVYVVLF